jgi:hypothetical protein
MIIFKGPSPIAGIAAAPVLARPNAVGPLGYLTIKKPAHQPIIAHVSGTMPIDITTRSSVGQTGSQAVCLCAAALRNCPLLLRTEEHSSGS